MNWKPTPRRAAWVLILVNLALWLIPSNVARQIARDRQTVLGWYSLEKFTIQALVLLLSVPALYILLGRPEGRRQRIFRVAAVFLILLPGLVSIDIIARVLRPPRFVQSETSYHRPANWKYESTFHDQPRARRTYPNAPAGYPPISFHFTCDARGFRNPAQVDSCDILAVGDSFVEGSEVSDEQPWARVLGASTGWSVYNLGMAGGNTHDYLLNLKNVGLALSPRVVLVMIYEGNDFRGTTIQIDRDEREDDVVDNQVALVFKLSPVVLAVRRAIEEHLTSLNATAWVPNAEALALMPVLVGPQADRHPYVFDPKDLLWFDFTAAKFAASKGFADTCTAVRGMADECRVAGARLVVLYAPNKPHVLMTDIADRPEQVRAFVSLIKRNLPPADRLTRQLREGVQAPEQAMADFCRRQNIDFLSLTPALRREMEAGNRVYFTYDQHWTPEGHAVVARAVEDYLKEHNLPGGARPASSRPSTAPASAPSK